MMSAGNEIDYAQKAWDVNRYSFSRNDSSDPWSSYGYAYETEHMIFEFYRNNDVNGLKTFMMEDVEEAYWSWQRILGDVKHAEGFIDMPYVLWAGTMFNSVLWGSQPTIRSHVERFLEEEFVNAPDTLKISFMDAYFTDDDWTCLPSAQYYRDELFRIALLLWKKNSKDAIKVLRRFYPLLMEKCLTSDDHDFDHGFLRWLIENDYLVSADKTDKTEPYLLYILRHGNVELVSDIVGVLLDHSRQRQYLTALNVRQDELNAPVEWLRAMFK